MEFTKEILPDSVVAQSPGLVAGDMGGEKVMLSIENGKYYAIDPVGSRIWDLIGRPCSVRELVTALVKEYDVAEEKCQHDVLAFLNKMYRKGLVVVD